MLVKTPEVTDYQVRQTACGIEVTLVAEGPLNQEQLCERLGMALRRAGLKEPKVTARTVRALDRQAGTGKLRRFIPA